MSDFYKLRSVQSQGARDLISTLRVVEINPLDICNRSCSFCPQSSDHFLPKRGRVSLKIIEKIANDLEEICFDGRVTFTGFGEPLLYKDLIAAISILKSKITRVQWIEVVTNGDYLTRERVLALDNAGCTNVTVSMYDGDLSHVFLPMFQNTDIDVTLKHSYNGFLEVNRNEMLVRTDILTKNDPCYLPFYKMVIDMDGNVILCSNDWSRSVDLGNIVDQSISSIWLDQKYVDYRKKLIDGNRKDCKPCSKCNIQGNLYGDSSVSIWKNNL